MTTAVQTGQHGSPPTRTTSLATPGTELFSHSRLDNERGALAQNRTLQQGALPRPARVGDREAARGMVLAFDAATGRQSSGWTNKLIWGDNKLVLASLKNGRCAMRLKPPAASSLFIVIRRLTSGLIFHLISMLGTMKL
jgi:hypothetical protein